MIGELNNACSSSTQIYGMTIQVANPVKSLRQNLSQRAEQSGGEFPSTHQTA
jgi:hypothetical protein